MLQMGGSVESDSSWKPGPFAMRFQERVDESTCATLPFRPCDMYNIETVDVIFLILWSTSCRYRLRIDIDTECPSSCSQPFIPTKLGVPFMLGAPFKLGIESRAGMLLVPSATPKLGLAVRRLLLRRAMALCVT